MRNQDIKWRTEVPSGKMYNGMQVIARHLSWHNEGDDQNPTPWTKINSQYFIAHIVNNDIHIEEDHGNDVSTHHIVQSKMEIITDEERHNYSQFYSYRIKQHEFFYDDGSQTHQWQWALLEG